MTTQKRKTQVLLAIGAAPYAVAGVMGNAQDVFEAVQPQQPTMGVIINAATTATNYSAGSSILFSVPLRSLAPDVLKPEPAPDTRADAMVQTPDEEGA
ncbi:MAG: hypothetical protein WC684_07800 [Hyphomicrobium sp.]|jgi:hypothetical protein